MTDLLVFGDSISEGLGARGLNYVQLLQDEYNFKVTNYARGGFTVKDSMEKFLANPLEAHFAVIQHGVTEPIIRPNKNYNFLLPPRWRRLGWMDPRAYYSSRIRRRIPEKIESAIRWRVKNGLIHLGGGYQLLNQDEYLSNFYSFASLLQKKEIRPLVIGPFAIDDRYFPGSSLQQEKYFASLKATLDVAFCDASQDLEIWDDYLLDHFHPNVSGHEKIASAVSRTIRTLS